MISTKLLRLPQRGALGNGLRVVAGAVLASEGTLTVITRNQRLQLRPERDGSTTVVSARPVKFPIGTRVEIVFGPALSDESESDNAVLRWARLAIELGRGSTYAGKTSPWWYDTPQFHELLSAGDDRPVRELVSQLDGCSGAKAGEIVAEAGLSRGICREVTTKQAEKLLLAARANAKQVKAKRLGAVGDIFSNDAYAVAYGEAEFGAAAPRAEIPYAVEVWASRPDDIDDDDVTMYVNRTPIAGDIEIARDRRDIDLFGCGLHHTVAKASESAHFNIYINITTPYMPITSDGKEPNLLPFLIGIMTACKKAVRKAHYPESKGGTQKDVVLDNLEAVIAEVSGDGEYRFNARQIFYGLRPIVMQELHQELQIGNFTGIIDGYEEEHGEIPLMYREPRGSITHPHRDETFTLGTLMVEEYERPVWTFNKLVYIEKEGANEALKDDGWLERHDCAVMSSKGFSTRAARDLIDKLAEHDEPITVFAVTDADAYGSMIYQTLQETTIARGGRKIEIKHLGLHPWEAIAMGLEVETLKESERRKPVADYVKKKRDEEHPNEAPSGVSWEEWLQTHRVELNAMTTPAFIAWLDAKMAALKTVKLVPPAKVLTTELDASIEKEVRARITERILREAGLDRQVAEAIRKVKKPSAATLAKGIRQRFKRQPDAEWRAHIEAERKRILKSRRRFLPCLPDTKRQ